MIFDIYNLIVLGYIAAFAMALGAICYMGHRFPKVVYPLIFLLVLTECTMPIADIMRSHAADPHITRPDHR